jgi:hypothetical protein
MIWKVEAQGDVVYVKGETIDEAELKFRDAFGEIPRKLVKWTEVSELPDGESFIYPD